MQCQVHNLSDINWIEKFWSKVDKTDDQNCWEWLGYRNDRGYGRVYNSLEKTNYAAHRVSYELYYGSINPDLTIDHVCNNTSCVNPSHLEQVTHRVNNNRGNSPSAINSRKTLCKRGHELSGYNLYITPDNRRQCKKCNKIRQLKSKRNKK